MCVYFPSNLPCYCMHAHAHGTMCYLAQASRKMFSSMKLFPLDEMSMSCLHVYKL